MEFLKDFQDALELVFMTTREYMCLPYYAELIYIIIDLNERGLMSVPSEVTKFSSRKTSLFDLNLINSF